MPMVPPGRRPGVIGRGKGRTACTGDMHADNACALVCHTCTPHAADKSYQLAVPTTKNYTVVQMESAGTPLHVHKHRTGNTSEIKHCFLLA